MSEHGTITCTTELQFTSDHGQYSRKGPSLRSAPYAPYDRTNPSYFGDSISFHANGLVMPNIQPEFTASIHYSDPGEVTMKLIDNRAGGSGEVGATVLFGLGTEYSIELAITNQDRLWLQEKSAGDQLEVVRMTCARRSY